jgi:hypothetical protein
MRQDDFEGEQNGIKEPPYYSTPEVKGQELFGAPMSLKCRAQEEQAEHIEQNMPQPSVQELVGYKSPELQDCMIGGWINSKQADQQSVTSQNLHEIRRTVYNQKPLDRGCHAREAHAHLRRVVILVLVIFASIISIVKAHDKANQKSKLECFGFLIIVLKSTLLLQINAAAKRQPPV